MDSGLAIRSANTNSSGRVPAMCTCFRSVRIHGRKRLEFSDPLVMFGQLVSLFPPRLDVINCRLKMMDGRKRIFFNQTSHSLEKNQKHLLICCQKRLITILLFVLSKESSHLLLCHICWVEIIHISGWKLSANVFGCDGKLKLICLKPVLIARIFMFWRPPLLFNDLRHHNVHAASRKSSLNFVTSTPSAFWSL